MKSLSEIETTSKRASKAIGFSWGVSEEVAKGIRLLELFGLPGIKNLNQYYKLINKKKFDNLLVINKNNKSNKSALCPINLGISFLDQIKKLESFKKITFSNIAYPILFIPFLSHPSSLIIIANSPTVIPCTIGTGCIPTKLLNFMSSIGPST